MDGQFKISYNENQRPRRPNEDTLSYIKSLPLEVDQAHREVNEYLEKKQSKSADNDDDDLPQLFSVALTAIDEIKTEIASLAGDEAGSQFLEMLTRIVAPYSPLAVRKLLAGCAGYYLHLSTHRYGSHVVQTLLQLATVNTVCNNDSNNNSHDDLARAVLDDAFEKEQEELPPLADLILGVAEELTPQASQLVMHICGSHVVRTLLCVLTGTDMVSSSSSPAATTGGDDVFRRGKKKNKKKKKKPDTATPAAARGMTQMVYRNPANLRMDVFGNEQFTAALDALTQQITSQANGQGVLQKMASHPSAGPFLIVLLRVLTYASCTDQAKWQTHDDDDNNPSTGGGTTTTSLTRTQRHLGMELEQPKFQLDSMAHQLAKTILCWPEDESPSSNQDNNASAAVADVIYGLAGEPRGSHVLETLFWCSPGPVYDKMLAYGNFFERATIQEYIDDPIGNFVIQTLLRTIQTKEQAEKIQKAILPIISSGSVIDQEKKRRGILWRAVEMAANHRVGQDATLKAIRLGFAALLPASSSKTTKPESSKEPGKKERKKASTINLSDCIVHLLDAKKDEASGRVTLDVMGARTAYYLLRFAPRLCEGTIEGIVSSYSPDMLMHFAKDGLASACIWDGLLEGPTESPTFSKGLKQLNDKLNGHWVSLSCDRCGQHVVKKIFRALPDQHRIKMVEELCRGIPQLSGSSMGRGVMDVCAVRDFSRGQDAWRSAVKKSAEIQGDWEKEVFGEMGATSVSSSKKKRKRPD
ncbi:RNA-binding nucleolar protein required for pre-rRNA processing. Involved in production of 18S rRNA and assembly of small ribosomal subunit (By similarity) [Seminavis robusta]|uniref:RNA-binding nucleolar protein required for pre-rRNA processing. Involved in production of 18S rRNA and assembly of small ribosomal subunit By similarity n=1 Tax=Seminavis robusta TaxID=568900 RepID=A0A9N8H493_9STRA|nr:RNA-binding nucleolar protein required for pre-rRNA processing. Involved in production of 18S rRNA and assembly of small ribosomal subunit (By similarity) [Seminavis robusta]|eukprot:Sro56_g032990.1 RNA-binding nucleolar protein required for pre-rRNA processing. Involved in production of 18S rRNA and assembly of small ribosomal subunit (By similarity) (755) ;mRNA; r:122564-124828